MRNMNKKCHFIVKYRKKFTNSISHHFPDLANFLKKIFNHCILKNKYFKIITFSSKNFDLIYKIKKK